MYCTIVDARNCIRIKSLHMLFTVKPLKEKFNLNGI
jgi:hypothetical protein